MNDKEAIRLLNDTFSNEFSFEKFSIFLNELFNGFYPKERSIIPHSEYADKITSIKKVGDYKHNNRSMEILVVKLKKGTSLDRARTLQRNVVAKLLKNFNIDSALVAFISEDYPDWRFSFVKMDYKLTEEGKVSEELTPAKRYSFLVGPNEPNHTCRSQFIELIKIETHKPSIDEIENSFSIEKVTKEFFEKYKNLYHNLKDNLDKLIKKDKNISEEFEAKQISTIDFSKKLLGQIVFLYFLQKKGWLGIKRGEKSKFEQWGQGPRRFIQELFYKSQKEKKNFFNDYLEPLFYHALATDRRADEDYYEKFDCKIPFLNGGLFEPLNGYNWGETDINLDNSIFEEIFRTFDEFNFTIKEDEPLEKEVAVDPEMLGKVFENLLDVEDRKSKGAFYTPREIVHYMCQQSLINYLETNTNIPRDDLEFFIQKGDLALEYLKRQEVGREVKEEFVLPDSIKKNAKQLDKLLVEIKICDPAVGSGAFPVGMMNEIIKARNILSHILKQPKTDYELKRETIENSLYGVDIEPSAVEITKLRFWLSLIVDEEDMNNIKPLPNLENKIMCGNSLIEEFNGIKLYIDPSEIKERKDRQATLDPTIEKKVKKSEQKLKELRQKQKEFFDVESRTQKNKLKEEIDRVEWEFIEETLREQGDGENMKKLEQYKKNKSKPFFLWKLYFSDVFHRDNPGFDVVLGNPPYVSLQRMKGSEIYANKGFKTYSKSSDIYCLFYEKGVQILRDGGSLTYITSNSWIRTKYGELIRSFFQENVDPLQLINFEDAQVFESAIVESNILILEKKHFGNKLNACNVQKDFVNYSSLGDYLEKKGVILKKLDKNGWIIGDEQTLNLKIKIEDNSDNIKNLGYYIVRGFTTGCNNAFYINKSKRSDLLNEDKKSSDLIKPILRGRDLKKWRINFQETYSIIMRKGIDIGKYPSLKNHLEKFKEPLEKKTGNAKWYEFQANPSQEIINSFSKDKIIWGELSDNAKFAYDTHGFFLDATVFLMIGKDLKYILPIFNSRLGQWYFEQISTSSGMGTNRWKKYKIEQFPIKKISKEKQKPFIEIVDKILDITKDEDYLKNPEKQAKVKAYGKRIDKMVYELYGLTKEEIKIVEKSLK